MRPLPHHTTPSRLTRWGIGLADAAWSPCRSHSDGSPCRRAPEEGRHHSAGPGRLGDWGFPSEPGPACLVGHRQPPEDMPCISTHTPPCLGHMRGHGGCREVFRRCHSTPCSEHARDEAWERLGVSSSRGAYVVVQEHMQQYEWFKNILTNVAASLLHTYGIPGPAATAPAGSPGSSHGRPCCPIKVPGAARPDATTSTAGFQSSVKSCCNAELVPLADYYPAHPRFSIDILSASGRAKIPRNRSRQYGDA